MNFHKNKFLFFFKMCENVPVFAQRLAKFARSAKMNKQKILQKFKIKNLLMNSNSLAEV